MNKDCFLTNSRTINEIFISWKGTDKISKSWSEYWNNQLKECIDFYEKLNWKLLCLSHNSKLPVKGVKWTQRNLIYENAYILLSKKMNIAVDLLKSNLIVAEIDEKFNNLSEILRSFFYETISIITTSSHFHLYFHYDIETTQNQRDKLENKLGISNLWRGCPNKNQYTVLPLSCVDHKYYEFLCKKRLMNFSELVGMI